MAVPNEANSFESRRDTALFEHDNYLATLLLSLLRKRSNQLQGPSVKPFDWENDRHPSGGRIGMDVRSRAPVAIIQKSLLSASPIPDM